MQSRLDRLTGGIPGVAQKVCLISAAAMYLAGCSVSRPSQSRVVVVAIRGGSADVRSAEGMRAAFEQAHPQIRIRLEHIPDKQYYAKLLTMLAGDSGPDVFGLTNGTIAPHVAKGTLLDLTPLTKSDPAFDLDDFFPQALNAYRFEGKLYGMPINFHAFALYYNKDLFDKMRVPYPSAEWDWDRLLKTALALTRDSDGDGRTDQYGIVFDSWLGAVAPWIWQNGGDIFDDPSRPTRCVLDSDRSVAAMQFLVDLKLRYGVAPGASETAEQGVVEMFYSGKVGMYPYLYIAGRMREYARGFEWDCAPLPKGPTGIRATWAGSGCYCINRKSQVADEAWEFVKFATGKQGMKIEARNAIAIPARRSVANSPAFLQPGEPPESKRVFFDAFSYARMNPDLLRAPTFLTVFQEEMDRALIGECDVRASAKRIVYRAELELRQAKKAGKGP